MRFLRWLDNQSLRRSAAIVVLSQDMAETLSARGLGDLPVHVINNFSLDLFEASEEPPDELRKPPGRRRVVFAGNLGRFQNLPQLAEGVSRLFEDFPDLELFFLGDGTALPQLKRRWGNHPQVCFGPFLPFLQAKSLIADADVGLISLEKDLYRVAYPSKIVSYVGQGVPVLALIEPQSNIAADIASEKLGATAIIDDPDAVAAALRQLLEEEWDWSAHLLDWATRNATASTLLPRWCELIDKFSPDGGAALSQHPGSKHEGEGNER